MLAGYIVLRLDVTNHPNNKDYHDYKVDSILHKQQKNRYPPYQHHVEIQTGQHEGHELIKLHDNLYQQQQQNRNPEHQQEEPPPALSSNNNLRKSASAVMAATTTTTTSTTTTSFSPQVIHKETATANTNNDVSASSIQSIVLSTEGSGATSVGFVKDLQYERSHPAFRNSFNSTTLTTTTRTTQVSQLANVALQSCWEFHRNDNTLSVTATCRDTDTVLYAYNRMNFTRSICGMEIPPYQVTKLILDTEEEDTTHDCLLQSTRHVFSQDSFPITGQGMPPIKVISQRNHNNHVNVASPTTSSSVKTIPVPCDIPCEYDATLMFASGTTDPVRTEHYIEGQDWKIIYDTYDSPRPMEKGSWKKDVYYSTLSRQSSIPYSNFDFTKYNLRDIPDLDYEFMERGATYFANINCQNSGTRRHKWINAFMATSYPVKAYGSCQHNTDTSMDISTM
jgi:hypothetical protein